MNIATFTAMARFDEPMVRAFMYRETFRHGPNDAGKIWNWIVSHKLLYLTIIAALVAAFIATSGRSGLYRMEVGATAAMMVLALTFMSYFMAKEPWWHERKSLPMHIWSPTLQSAFKHDPNFSVEEQILKFVGDPDAYELAHVIWLVVRNSDGTETRRGIVLWSSLTGQRELAG